MNPAGKRTGDCIMRAVSAAAEVSWDEAVDALCAIAHEQRVAPQDPAAERELLRRLGFVRMKQPRKASGKKLTGREFCAWLDAQVAAGEGAVAGTGAGAGAGALTAEARIVANIGAHHTVAVLRDSSGHFRVHDTWDCTTRCIGSWWVK